jgi:hypothetical protein
MTLGVRSNALRGLEAPTMKRPVESSRDPFRLARGINSRLENARLSASFLGGEWLLNGEPTPSAQMSAHVAKLLKEMFDADNLVDGDGRVYFITTELVADVLQALAALVLKEQVHSFTPTTGENNGVRRAR